MPLEIETQQLIYLLIPILVIIVGIYFLLIHKRTCSSCGRPIRPLWRECPCASEPSIVFSHEPAGEREAAPPPEEKPFSFNELQSLSEAGTETGTETEIGTGTGIGTETEIGTETAVGTEVMLPSVPAALLLIEEGGKPQTRYEMKATVISIGTSDDNDIILKDKAISRHHAKIRLEGKKCFVYDLASTNGTRVNGRKITKKWIKDGDTIEMGHTKMTFKPNEKPEYRPSNLLKM
jgi:hypothetical protein